MRAAQPKEHMAAVWWLCVPTTGAPIRRGPHFCVNSCTARHTPHAALGRDLILQLTVRGCAGEFSESKDETFGRTWLDPSDVARATMAIITVAFCLWRKDALSMA